MDYRENLKLVPSKKSRQVHKSYKGPRGLFANASFDTYVQWVWGLFIIT